MNRQKTICGTEKPIDIPKGRAAKQCKNCNVWFHLPRCHAPRHKCCSAQCSHDLKTAKAKKRERECRLCGDKFIPRPRQIRLGQGVYCSIACLGKVLHTYKTPEMEEKRITAVREKIATGDWTYLRGPDNPLWKGGPAAASRRQIESGKAKERTRKYRQRNPHKVREWTQKREAGYTGRLPYGTIPKLMKLQKGKCASCLCDVRKNYHVDHITPIAKGGKHEPHNLQILCPKCNLQKSDLMPADFARRKGRLL